MTQTILPHDIPSAKNDPAANYSVLSVLTHWLGVLAVLIMAITQQAGWSRVHLGLGLLLALPLIWRVLYRISRGFPRPPDQHPAISFIERMIILALLLAMFLLAVTGLLMPLLSAVPYEIFNWLIWTAPYEGSPAGFALAKNIHTLSASAVLILFVLHFASFARHVFITKKGNTTRILKPIGGGK